MEQGQEKPSFKTNLQANLLLWARIEKYLRANSSTTQWIDAQELAMQADIAEVCKSKDHRAEVSAILSQMKNRNLVVRPERGLYFWNLALTDPAPQEQKEAAIPEFLRKNKIQKPIAEPAPQIATPEIKKGKTIRIDDEGVEIVLHLKPGAKIVIE